LSTLAKSDRFIFLRASTIVGILLSIFTSCIGTIEDKNPRITKGASTDVRPISFEGIHSAVAIADTKIDVFFMPSTLDKKDATYLISYDGLINPISIPGTTLVADYRGLLKYTVRGLEINTNYTFSVQVRNSKGNVSTSNAVYTEQTFSNVTADFNGISNVRNLSGDDGRTSLRIEWPSARTEGNTFYPKELDPNQYEIILLNADKLQPNSFDDNSFGEPNRKVFYVASNKVSHQVNGLAKDTKYYVRVRAIHQGYIDYGADVDYKKEQNSNYILAATLSDDAADIDYDPESFNLEILSQNSVEITWNAASGPFSHYRVYYRNRSDDGLNWDNFKTSSGGLKCDGPVTGYTEWFCKKLDFSKTSAKIADLIPRANYDFVLVICITNECTFPKFLEFKSDNPYTINPGLASFDGIIEIEQPKYYWAVDEVYIKVTPPDLSSGSIDGLIVELLGRSIGSPSTDTYLNHPTVASTFTDITVDSFDYTVDETITINGLDPNSSEQYCFIVLPYVYTDGEIVVNRTGQVRKCINPTIALPTEAQFDGVDSSKTFPDTATNSVAVGWTKPDGGIYDYMRIFIRESSGGGVFSFADATNPLSSNYSDYVMVQVPYGEENTSYTFSFLPNGIYQIGVIPYYSNDDLYSSGIGNIYTFDTDD